MRIDLSVAWFKSLLQCSIHAGDIAFDMAWPGVRAAVLENLTQLVDNPHAQPVLKRALPQLATLLADPVLKVGLRLMPADFSQHDRSSDVSSLHRVLCSFINS